MSLVRYNPLNGDFGGLFHQSYQCLEKNWAVLRFPTSLTSSELNGNYHSTLKRPKKPRNRMAGLATKFRGIGRHPVPFSCWEKKYCLSNLPLVYPLEISSAAFSPQAQPCIRHVSITPSCRSNKKGKAKKGNPDPGIPKGKSSLLLVWAGKKRCFLQTRKNEQNHKNKNKKNTKNMFQEQRRKPRSSEIRVPPKKKSVSLL